MDLSLFLSFILLTHVKNGGGGGGLMECQCGVEGEARRGRRRRLGCVVEKEGGRGCVC